GNLEVIDVDCKNHPDGSEMLDRLWGDLVDYFGKAVPLIPVQTPSGGCHIYYRCAVIEGNKKLASVERDGKVLTVVETRGQGGYVIAPPSPGYSTPMDLVTIREITPEQRADILDICRKYNEVFRTERTRPPRVQSSAYRETPWDHYNADTDEPWAVILAD